MRRAVVVTCCLALSAAACGGDDEPVAAGGAGVPTVVATTSIWSDVVGNVACDGAATVTALIPAGADPHAFEPSLQDRGRLEGADLVVANGLGLEETLEDTLDAVADEGTPVLELAPLAPGLLTGGHDHGDEAHSDEEHGDEAHGDEEHGDEAHGDEEHGDEAHGDEAHGDEAHSDEAHDHGDEGKDPHVWQDPARVLAVLEPLADALVTEAGLDPAVVEGCVAAYRSELEALDAELEETYGSIPADRRLLVTNHGSLAYLADRYGFEVVGSVIPSSSSLAEAGPADLEALAEEIAATGAPAIFAESMGSSTDAEALAAEVGIPVVTLTTDSLGAPGSGAETYTGMLRTNATLIVDALS